MFCKDTDFFLKKQKHPFFVYDIGVKTGLKVEMRNYTTFGFKWLFGTVLRAKKGKSWTGLQIVQVFLVGICLFLEDIVVVAIAGDNLLEEPVKPIDDVKDSTSNWEPFTEVPHLCDVYALVVIGNFVIFIIRPPEDEVVYCHGDVTLERDDFISYDFRFHIKFRFFAHF